VALERVNISGATSSSLVLSSVGGVSQGVYTVLIRNGTAAVISSGAVLAVYALAVTGQWDFDRGDLRRRLAPIWSIWLTPPP